MLFSGCSSTSNAVKTKFRHQGKDKFSSPSEFYLFYENVPEVEFWYIGEVEALGRENASGSDVLRHFCKKAFDKGANAIIQIEEGYYVSKGGLLLYDEDLSESADARMMMRMLLVWGAEEITVETMAPISRQRLVIWTGWAGEAYGGIQPTSEEA